MKTWGLVAVVLGLVAASVALAGWVFERVVEQAIETAGPVLTGTSVELDDVELSLFDGRGSVKGLVIGNPKGFKTHYAIRVREARVQLVPSSVLGDKIVIRDVRIDSPEINFERKDDTNNLERILEHLQSALGAGAGGGVELPDGQAIWDALIEQKLQIDHLLMKDAEVHATAKVLDTKSLDLPPFSIELSELGSRPKGASVARVSATVMRKISTQVSLAVTKQVVTLGLGGDAEQDDDPSDERPRRQRRRQRD